MPAARYELTPVEKFKRALDIWTKIASNVRLRDRIVKVIQYGCQMLIGYYGAKMSEEVMLGVKTTRRTASTARKAFWLLKSLNHIGSIANMLDDNLLAKPLDVKLDFIEQVSLVFYYVYENLVFLARCNLFNFNEDDLDWGTNVSWFVGDLAFLLSSSVRLHGNAADRQKVINELAELDRQRRAWQQRDGASPNRANGARPGAGDAGALDAQVTTRRRQLETELRKLSSAQCDLLLSFAIVRGCGGGPVCCCCCPSHFRFCWSFLLFRPFWRSGCRRTTSTSSKSAAARSATGPSAPWVWHRRRSFCMRACSKLSGAVEYVVSTFVCDLFLVV